MVSFGRYLPTRPVGSAGLERPYAGSSTASVSFDPSLATRRSYFAWFFDSRCTASLKRSIRRFCNITLNCSLVVPAGTFAEMSNKDPVIHSGVWTWNEVVEYACVTRPFKLRFTQRNNPGLSVPGPPVIETVKTLSKSGGGDGFIGA